MKTSLQCAEVLKEKQQKCQIVWKKEEGEYRTSWSRITSIGVIAPTNRRHSALVASFLNGHCREQARQEPKKTIRHSMEEWETKPDEVKKEYDDLIWKVQSNRKDKRHEIMNSILSHGLNASQLLMKSKGTNLIWIKRNFVLSAAQGPDILAWLLCAWHNSVQDRSTAAFLSYFCSSLIRGALLCVLGQACCCGTAGCRLKGLLGQLYARTAQDCPCWPLQYCCFRSAHLSLTPAADTPALQHLSLSHLQCTFLALGFSHSQMHPS